ncbi:hypothetical protein BXZ70DRAFT_80875 [Cristinia sonorae]|uniref:Uncharacterized protein n=1 Tax=Cristinia sonorae TaxID=1940300 RepID=A0A8K0USW5_9AGAR|nr:hypothetical protein BXZ70DRAFT_80875 [Cristinia sonorae]
MSRAAMKMACVGHTVALYNSSHISSFQASLSPLCRRPHISAFIHHNPSSVTMGFIDNRDPRVQYYGSWGHFTDSGSDLEEEIYNGTLSSTSEGDSSFKMSFDINDLDETPLSPDDGIAISVCGNVVNAEPDRNLTVLFSVDHLKPERVDLRDAVLGDCFFQSSVLDAPGSHSLTVHVLDPSSNHGILGFDYASVDPVPLPKSSSHRSKSAGAIVGIIIGAVAFLVVCAGALLAWRRKLRRKAYVVSRAKDLEHRMAVLSGKKAPVPPGPTLPAPALIDNKVDSLITD